MTTDWKWLTFSLTGNTYRSSPDPAQPQHSGAMTEGGLLESLAQELTGYVMGSLKNPCRIASLTHRVGSFPTWMRMPLVWIWQAKDLCNNPVLALTTRCTLTWTHIKVGQSPVHSDTSYWIPLDDYPMYLHGYDSLVDAMSTANPITQREEWRSKRQVKKSK